MAISQQEVVERYREDASDAATMGDYVYVQHGRDNTACFGPRTNREPSGWKVVMIDFQKNDFVLAPLDAGIDAQEADPDA